MKTEIHAAHSRRRLSKPLALEKATFAAGCFWGIEDAFSKLHGVLSTRVGYIGGKTKNPTYEQVCSDSTGHAEAVEVGFNPNEISYEKLVEFFFSLHNPTSINRQGPDVGSQYRSAIFYHSPSQRKSAEKIKSSLGASGNFSSPIATEISPASAFCLAEEYHQKYMQKHKGASCHI